MAAIPLLPITATVSSTAFIVGNPNEHRQFASVQFAIKGIVCGLAVNLRGFGDTVMVAESVSYFMRAWDAANNRHVFWLSSNPEIAPYYTLPASNPGDLINRCITLEV
jgi:hypothetical protein